MEVTAQILTAYYDRLINNISVPVYKSVRPVQATANEDHVMLRFESESLQQNNTAWLKNPVIILEVVTYGTQSVDVDRTYEIMSDCMDLIFDTPGKHNLCQIYMALKIAAQRN
jgi:hypothetical protein